MEEWSGFIAEQLASTDGQPALKEHRDLLSKRWEKVQSFTDEGASSTTLSPDSKALKKALYEKSVELSEQQLNGFKKKLAGMLQALENASERLNALQREEVGNLTTRQSFVWLVRAWLAPFKVCST